MRDVINICDLKKTISQNEKYFLLIRWSPVVRHAHLLFGTDYNHVTIFIISYSSPANYTNLRYFKVVKITAHVGFCCLIFSRVWNTLKWNVLVYSLNFFVLSIPLQTFEFYLKRSGTGSCTCAQVLIIVQKSYVETIY